MSGIPEAPGAQRARQAALRRALDYLQAVGVPADEALDAAAAALRAAEGSGQPFADVMGELRLGLARRRRAPPAAPEIHDGCAPSPDSPRQGPESPGPRVWGDEGRDQTSRADFSAGSAVAARPLDGLAAYAGSVEACGLLASMPAMLRGHMTPEAMDRSPWRTPLQRFDAWLVLTSTTVSNSRLGVAMAHAILVIPPYLLGDIL